MKKLIFSFYCLTLAFVPCWDSNAYNENDESYSDIIVEKLSIPVLIGFFGLFLIDGAISHSPFSYPPIKKNQIISYKKPPEFIKQIPINLDNQNAFIGDEKENLSHYKKMDDYRGFFKSTPPTYYLCINRKPTSIFPKGCQDILDQNIQPVKGIWYLNKILMVNFETYLQFRQQQANGKNIVATTELENVDELINQNQLSFDTKLYLQKHLGLKLNTKTQYWR